MSNSIKELFDYDLIKKCSKCGNISLKSNFHKNSAPKDGLKSQCKDCREIYRQNYYHENRESALNYNKKSRNENREQIKTYYRENKEKKIKRIVEYQKNRRETDSSYKLIWNLRTRTRKVFRAQNVNKRNKTLDLLDCSHSFFKKWIESQLYGNMTPENFGKIWQIDHCLPVSSFNLLDEKEKRKCFGWCNLRPMYVKENISKSNKIDYWLYTLQEIKARYFLRNINEQKGFD